jgi:hypothetical protein
MKVVVLWVIEPCSLAEVYRRFTGATASIIIDLMMEAVTISESSINFYLTSWRNNPEYSHIQKDN